MKTKKTPPKQFMSLSLAIREGCKKTSEAHSTYTQIRCDVTRGNKYEACAIGSAYWGANGTPNKTTVDEMPNRKHLINYLRRKCGPIVRQRVEMPQISWFNSGIDEGRFAGEERMPMWAAVEHLFEGCNWTRQQVADFCATYEDPNS